MTPRHCLVVLLLLIGGLYARSCWNDFVYDDRFFVMVPAEEGFPNTMVAEWQGVARYFTTPYGFGTSGETRNLRPTTVMSFALVHLLAPGPFAQHLVSLGLHLLATFLAFLLLRGLVRHPWAACWGAAIFGLHALRSDQILAIVGRSEILSFVFGATAVLLAAAARTRGGVSRVLLLILVALSALLAYGAKESALAWAVYLPLYLLVQRRLGRGGEDLAGDRWGLLGGVAAAFGAALLFGGMLISVAGTSEMILETINNPLARADLGVRIGTGVMILGFACAQILMPFDLHADYSYRTFELVESVGDARLWAAGLVLGGLLVWSLRNFRRRPMVFLAAATFLGFSFATSNLLVPIASIYGERHMYTPGFALCIFVAWWLDGRLGRGTRSWSTRITLGLVVTWLGANAVIIHQRCGHWASNRTLFEHESETQPRSIRMHLAAAWEASRRSRDAGLDGEEGAAAQERWKFYLDRALAVDPEHPRPLIDLALFHVEVAEAHRARGAKEAAAAALEAAQMAARTALESPQREAYQDRSIYGTLAHIAALRGDPKEQLRCLQRAFEADPGSVESCGDLARFYQATGRLDEQGATLARGLQLRPRADTLRVAALEAADARKDLAAYERLLREGEALYPDGHAYFAAYRGILLTKTGKPAEALAIFEVALPAIRAAGRRPPDQALYAHAFCLASTGAGPRALELLEASLRDPQLNPSLRVSMERLRTSVRSQGRRR